MDLAPELNRKSAPLQRWFLRSQGLTLGPLETRELEVALERGDVQLSDKVCPHGASTWRELSELSVFSRFASKSDASANVLRSPPSPRNLRRKVSPPLPPIPLSPPAPLTALLAEPPPTANVELEAAPVPEAIPEALPLPEVAALPETPAEADTPELISEIDFEAAAKALEAALDKLSELKELGDEPPVPAEPAPVAPELKIDASIPVRPSYSSVKIAEPAQWGGSPAESPAPASKRVIRIELKLPERPWRLLILLFMVLGIAYVLGSWNTQNKTRDLKDFRLPDPSSPTTAPLEAGDPIPPLKAPTRPQRE